MSSEDVELSGEGGSKCSKNSRRQGREGSRGGGGGCTVESAANCGEKGKSWPRNFLPGAEVAP